MLGEKERKSKIIDNRNKMRPHLISVDPYPGWTLPSLTSLLPWPGADTGAHPECHHIHPHHHSQSCSVPCCTSAVPPSNPGLWSQKQFLKMVPSGNVLSTGDSTSNFVLASQSLDALKDSEMLSTRLTNCTMALGHYSKMKLGSLYAGITGEGIGLKCFSELHYQ